MTKQTIIILVLVAGVVSCDFGPSSCEALQSCALTIAFEQVPSTDDDQLVDLVLTFSSSEPASTYMHDDPLCNLRFYRRLPAGEKILSSSRMCVARKGSLPDEPYRDWGENAERRTYYVHSPRNKTIFAPDRGLVFRLRATISTGEDGVTTVLFADDVYFAFRDNVNVRLSLPMRQRMLFDSGEGGLDAYFQASREIVDGRHEVIFTQRDR